MSLGVVDLAKSRDFYALLGFKPIGGNEAEDYLILSDGQTEIGLFHAMFEGNMLTFNPGWASEDTPVAEFEDIRDIQKRLAADGVEIFAVIDKKGSGPAELQIKDPDGNVILIDQHV